VARVVIKEDRPQASQRQPIPFPDRISDFVHEGEGERYQTISHPEWPPRFWLHGLPRALQAGSPSFYPMTQQIKLLLPGDKILHGRWAIKDGKS